MTFLTPLFIYLLLAFAVLLLFLGTRADISTKRAIGSFLTGEKTDWATTFLSWFDRVFRVRRVFGIALPSPLRSVLVSCVALLILASVWVLNKETLSRPLRFEGTNTIGSNQTFILLTIYGGVTVFTNWIPDFLSLVQSRFVMERMAKTDSPFTRIGWLGLDALFTLCIAFCAILVGGWIVLPLVSGHVLLEVGCFTTETFTIESAATIFWSGLRFTTPPATLNYDAAGIYIYSTFLTSLWVWLYLGSGLLVRAVVSLYPSLRPRAADHPMPTLGFAAILTFSMLYWPFTQRHHDVYVAHGIEDTHIALSLVEELEANNLSAVATIDDRTNTARSRASTVILVGRNVDVDLIARQTRQDIRCGRLPRGAMHFYQHDSGDTVHWAKHAPTFLSFEQIAECRNASGMPSLPECNP